MHTFSTKYFAHLAHSNPKHAGLFHLLGEVEVELPGEPPLDSLEWVDGWEAALGLLDRYPWARLHPVEVHPEFRERMRVAVEERLADVDSESAERATEKWDRLLRQP